MRALTLLAASACCLPVLGYQKPAPPSMVQPDPTEYLNWLPNHPGHGHFHSKNSSVLPWHPRPYRPPHYPHPQCGVQHPAHQNSFWLPNFHGAYEGTSPFLVNGTDYVVFRNVRDFGAVGDGRTDDTAAFTRAITGRSSFCVLDLQ